MAIDWSAILGSAGSMVGLGAVGQGLGSMLEGGAATGKGALIGGTVMSSGGGRITIKTSSGKMVVIKRAKHRRYARRAGGGMNSMLKQAMQYKMLMSAMK